MDQLLESEKQKGMMLWIGFRVQTLNPDPATLTLKGMEQTESFLHFRSVSACRHV
jgi:hypothetical protein